MKRWMIFGILVVLGLGSCAPVYVPNVRNSPLFTKAGEFQGAMVYGTSGLDLQAAVAVTNNFALMGNYSYGNRNTDSVTEKDYHKHQFAEGAIGYFKNDRSFCFEVFLGYGQGNGTSNTRGDPFISPNNYMATGKFNRIFFQPAFGLNKRFVNVSFSPRISWVDFTQYSSTSRPKTIDVSPKIFFEPAVTARFNFMDNRFFGMVQVGFVTPVNGSVVFDYEAVNISTGLGFRLGGLHWTPKEKPQQ